MVLSIIGLGGCVGPPALRSAVMNYDETVTQLDQQILLLNVARLSEYHPPHFTVTSSIAATFNFEAGGSIGGSLFATGGSGTNVLTLGLESRAAENPTFSIVPISGREFTERVLQPLGENTFTFFAFQGVRIDLLGRLMADAIELLDDEGRTTAAYFNKVSEPEQLPEFRRMILHLAALQSSHRLFITRLTYDQVILAGVPNPPSTGDVVSGLEKGFTWTQNPDNTFRLTRRVVGRVLLSDYDPQTLNDVERQTLNKRASRLPDNYVFIDVRDGRIGRRETDPPEVGQPFPIQGALKLRSLFAVLDFVGKGIDKFSEPVVQPDPRSGRLPSKDDDRNPQHTLAIDVSADRPADGRQWIEYNDQYFAVGDSKWDRQAFTILYELFQVTVTEVNGIGIPVTIAK